MQLFLFKKKSTAIPVEKPLPSLGACILMDLIGMSSYAIPVLGEMADVIWAPISAGIYLKMFGVKKGFFGASFNFIEELLPGLDIIPTFTITWFIQYFKRSNQVYKMQPARR